MIDGKTGESLLRAAESAALLAGNYLRSRRAEWKNLQKTVDHDLKITGDRNAEDLILEQLRGTGISVFSEESGAVPCDKFDSGTLLWIVDPLDGTLNYHQGIPLCCVSIALYDGMQGILGVVYDFNHDELFGSQIGKGAWLNHRPIHPSKVDTVSLSVLATGFPVRTDFSGLGIAKFVEEVQNFRKVRLLGSAALSLCYVACGRVDAYRESGIMFWDVAAGCAVVEAAGGTVAIEKMASLSSPVDVIATNGRLETTI
jgi:myo-inositol-1(or 4)-monophosphatase